MNQSPSSYLRANGIAFSRERGGANGDQLRFPCPVCGKREGCAIAEATWLWKCHRASCGASGGQQALLEALGHSYALPSPSGKGTFEEYRRESLEAAMKRRVERSAVERWRDALWGEQGAHALEYLRVERGLSDETIRQALLGFSALNPNDPNAAFTPAQAARRGIKLEAQDSPLGYLTIPYVTRHHMGEPDPGSVTMVKLRALSPEAKRRYSRLKGGDSPLYTPAGLDVKQTLWIVGGEIDALTLVQVGVENVVSVGNGEGSWSDLWSKQIEEVREIILCLDNDEAGRIAADKTAAIIGRQRTTIARWPNGHKDANAALLKMGDAFDVFAVQALISSPEAVQPTNDSPVVTIASLEEAFYAHLDSDSIHGRETGWRDLDELIGGWRRSELTVVTGETGCGKTTFTAQAALYYASQHGPCLYLPLEMGPMKQLRKWVTQTARAPLQDLGRREVEDCIAWLKALPLYMFWRSGIELKPMIQTIRTAIERMGVEFVVLDHLNWLLKGPDQTEQVGAWTQALAELTVSTGAHVLMVAHPHNVRHDAKDGNRDETIVQLSDLKGGSAIRQNADNGLSVFKPRPADREKTLDREGFGNSTIYSIKQRDDMGEEGGVGLRFHAPSALMVEAYSPTMKAGKGRPHWRLADMGESVFGFPPKGKKEEA